MRVVRITGPARNLLGLEIAERPADHGAIVEDLAGVDPIRGGVEAGGLNPAAVQREVLAGLDAARQAASGRLFTVRRIQFVGTDP